MEKRVINAVTFDFAGNSLFTLLAMEAANQIRVGEDMLFNAQIKQNHIQAIESVKIAAAPNQRAATNRFIPSLI